MSFLSTLSPHAHWLLRISIASVFIYHGVGKFPNLENMSEMLGLPVFIVLLVALAETVGGLLVLVSGFIKDPVKNGLGTRLGALMNIPVIIGAIVMVHWGKWSFVASETHPMGGMEFQVTLLLILLYLFVKGEEA